LISITNYNNRNKPASTAATTATTTESESNQQSTTSSSEPLNKKLRLLKNLESDHESTTVTAMETAMMTIPAKRFASFRRWQLTWALQF